jgi:uncharacterized protein (TIGR02391 family)
MHELVQEFPDADMLLALEPHELGIRILRLIKKRFETERNSISIHNAVGEATSAGDYTRGVQGYPSDKRHLIALAVMEAFVWLRNTGLLVPEPGANSASWFVLSRRAQEINSGNDFVRLSLSALLPRTILHRSLQDNVWSSFIRGELDVAVFIAMKQVEVRVREAAGYQESDHGVPMIRKAFHKDTGPLRDPSQNEAEKEALTNLFAGAIGSYKNPHSHRNVPLDEPSEAIEIILLANHLLRIVDTRASTLGL